MSTDFIRYRRALQPGFTASADLSMVYYIIWHAPALVDSVHDLSFFLTQQDGVGKPDGIFFKEPKYHFFSFTLRFIGYI
jgi:hypothetical protein